MFNNQKITPSPSLATISDHSLITCNSYKIKFKLSIMLFVFNYLQIYGCYHVKNPPALIHRMYSVHLYHLTKSAHASCILQLILHYHWRQAIKAPFKITIHTSVTLITPVNKFGRFCSLTYNCSHQKFLIFCMLQYLLKWHKIM